MNEFVNQISNLGGTSKCQKYYHSFFSTRSRLKLHLSSNLAFGKLPQIHFTPRLELTRAIKHQRTYKVVSYEARSYLRFQLRSNLIRLTKHHQAHSTPKLELTRATKHHRTYKVVSYEARSCLRFQLRANLRRLNK